MINPAAPSPPVWDTNRYGRLTRAQRMLGVVRRAVPNRSLFVPVLSGIAQGVSLPINPRCELRTWLGLAEIEIARTVRRLIPEGEVAWDVGAAIGYYSLAFARLGASRVLAFEPDDERFDILTETLARNPRIGVRVVASKLALGIGRSATSIDDIISRDSEIAPALLKIDVDGPEAEILGGAERTLAQHRPRLVIETHGFELEVACLEILVRHGYVYRIVDAQQLWPELRPIEVNRWIVATHREDDAANVILRKRLGT